MTRSAVADSSAVTVTAIWDRLSRAGKHVIVVGVPQTSPPVPVNGELVSCFLTSDPRTDPYTYPPELRAEIEKLVGTYRVDVRNFRSDDRDRILAEVYEMTEQRFRSAAHLLDTTAMGLLHARRDRPGPDAPCLLAFLDPEHPRIEPEHRYRDAIRNYYAYLDEEIGELLERFDDDTHGARRLRPRRPADARRDLRQRMARAGGLPRAQRSPPAESRRSARLKVDWSRTRAWGEGGYYCRLCLNVAGREPQGIVDPPRTGGAHRRADRAPGGDPRARRAVDRHAVLSPARSSGASATASRRI